MKRAAPPASQIGTKVAPWPRHGQDNASANLVDQLLRGVPH